MVDARRTVQQAERALRHERARLASLAAAHFPELEREPLVHFGAADGAAFQRSGLLVQRTLEQYNGPDGAAQPAVIADLLSARHRVLQASWQDADGHARPCVLKEYPLDATGVAWGRRARSGLQAAL